MNASRRSYVGAPRVYLTNGIHDDGQWKRMWYVNAGFQDGRHFWNWHEAIDYALSLPVPKSPRSRRGRSAVYEKALDEAIWSGDPGQVPPNGFSRCREDGGWRE